MAVSYPGVYIDEVSSGVRPIQAASTSTAAFLGKAERGPIGVPTAISNFTEYQTIFGGFLTDFYLTHAVYQFFNNGGSRCYVVRVARGDAAAASATINDRNSTAKPSLRIAASSLGEWGNSLEATIEDSPSNVANSFSLVVQRAIPGKPDLAQLERYDGLTMNPSSPDYVVGRVNGRSKYLTVEPLAVTANATAGYLEGSDLTTEVALAAATRKFRISINGDGFQQVDLTGADVSTLAKIAEALQAAIRQLKFVRRTAHPDTYAKATVTLSGQPAEGEEAQGARRIRITSGVGGDTSSVELEKGPFGADAAALLGLTAPAEIVDGAAVLRPQKGHYLIGDGEPKDGLASVVAGTDGTNNGTPSDVDYVNALNLLDTLRDISLIAIPGNGQEAVAAAGMNYCERRPLSDCFYIADMAADDKTSAQAKAWRDEISPVNSYGAVYFPWLYMLDPNGGAEPIAAPPSGFVAGVYARTDAQRGVWKTPAGTQTGLAGAVGLTADITDVDHGELNLNPKSVSVIRRFPNSGNVIWGGRTLSADPEWSYIAPRRMAIFLRVSIFNGIQWAVFEPNDEPLWSQLRLNLTSFMTTLFRKGAFQGSTPSEAFFVKVDKETTTQDDINAGVVNILVGFAPLKPAEFVVVKLSQKAGQS